MSFSFNTQAHRDELQAAVKGASKSAVLPVAAAAESQAAIEKLVQAAIELAEVVGGPADEIAVSASGHINPGHESDGGSNDGVTLHVSVPYVRATTYPS